MRYALYFTPPQDDPLTAAAARWLGRDAFTAIDFPVEDDTDLPAHVRSELTADPRRYGFHATLKAPFELSAPTNESSLINAAKAFAAKTAPFVIPELTLGQLGRFFALVPATEDPTLQAFAASVVEHFEDHRAPLSDNDIARRKPEKLTETQRRYLHRWGYPYVMEEFRFHMTLTGQVPEEWSAIMRQKLEARFQAFIGKPLAISGIALFTEESRGAAFQVHHWLPLTGA